jgi:mRNA interferase MazF
MARTYVPERGDIVWLEFSPQAGHEPAGLRPALVLSSGKYNRLTGLGLFCPITSRVKGYPFEVPLPDGLKISGVVLADQIKSLDWRARNAKRAATMSEKVMSEIVERLSALILTANN